MLGAVATRQGIQLATIHCSCLLLDLFTVVCKTRNVEWNGLVEWTRGMDSWNGLMEWTRGMAWLQLKNCH